jgi:HPt (histidine-containing phosphotransfer) domain-containing protein
VRLGGVEGINLEDGIAHTGGLLPYIKVMRQFCSGFDRSISTLQKLIEENNVKAYHVKIHALKGVFATLGVRVLSEWARRLEIASSEDSAGGFSENCLKEAPLFIDECKTFFNRLPNELKTNVWENKDQKQGDKKNLAPRLIELKSALENGHANSINDIIKELCELSFDEKTDGFISELSCLSADFDYDIAAQNIEKYLDEEHLDENILSWSI